VCPPITDHLHQIAMPSPAPTLWGLAALLLIQGVVSSPTTNSVVREMEDFIETEVKNMVSHMEELEQLATDVQFMADFFEGRPEAQPKDLESFPMVNFKVNPLIGIDFKACLNATKDGYAAFKLVGKGIKFGVDVVKRFTGLMDKVSGCGSWNPFHSIPCYYGSFKEMIQLFKDTEQQLGPLIHETATTTAALRKHIMACFGHEDAVQMIRNLRLNHAPEYVPTHKPHHIEYVPTHHPKVEHSSPEIVY